MNLCVYLDSAWSESENFTENQTCNGVVCAKAFLFQRVSVIFSGQKLPVIGLSEIWQDGRIVYHLLLYDNFSCYLKYV